MTDAVATIARVQRARAWLVASDAADSVWLGEALALWIAGAPFDAAVGLGGGWRDKIRARQQETALKTIHASLPPMSARAAATAVAALVARYEAAGWPADRATGRRPGNVNGCVYDYLTAGGASGVESLRKRLAWVAEVDAITHGAA